MLTRKDLFQCMFGLVLGCARETPERSEAQILGGVPVGVGEFPAVVSVFTDVPGPGIRFCSGTLITPGIVLTAAHCVDPGFLGLSDQEQVTQTTSIIFDSNDIFQPQGFSIPAAKTIKHPAFVDGFFEAGNDVGLVVLDTAITDRAPAVFDTTPGRELIGADTTLVGYGRTNPTDPASEGKLFRLEETFVDCSLLGGFDDNFLLCLDVRDGTGSCFGDSGGPAFVDLDGVPTIVGVFSFLDLGNIPCNSFNGYAKISAELDFLLPAIEENRCAPDLFCEAGCGELGTSADPDCACGDGATTGECDSNLEFEFSGGLTSCAVSPEASPVVVFLFVVGFALRRRQTRPEKRRST